MKKSTIIWIVVGVVALAAVPVVVMAARGRRKDITPDKKPGKKASVSAGPTEKQTEEEFERDRAAANKPVLTGNPLFDIGQTVAAAVKDARDYVVVTKGSDLNVREKPSATSEKIGSVANGTVVKAKPSGTPGWFALVKGGYVSSNFLRLKVN